MLLFPGLGHTEGHFFLRAVHLVVFMPRLKNPYILCFQPLRGKHLLRQIINSSNPHRTLENFIKQTYTCTPSINLFMEPPYEIRHWH